MQNIEFKAELRDRELAEALLLRTGAVRIASLEQTDTYYRVADGFLKRRESEDEPVEWIFYHRSAQTAPKVSKFTIYTEREARERFGTRPLPVWVIINKHRDMWIHGALRIHLDHVVGLGDFIEIEALVTPKRGEDECRKAVNAMRERMQLVMGEPIGCGYADLAARDAA